MPSHDDMPKADLHYAWSWTCTRCGQGTGHTAKLIMQYQADDDVTHVSQLISYPETVECPSCGTEHVAVCPEQREGSVTQEIVPDVTREDGE